MNSQSSSTQCCEVLCLLQIWAGWLLPPHDLHCSFSSGHGAVGWAAREFSWRGKAMWGGPWLSMECETEHFYCHMGLHSWHCTGSSCVMVPSWWLSPLWRLDRGFQDDSLADPDWFHLHIKESCPFHSFMVLCLDFSLQNACLVA